jgi:hypothetical protein
LIPLLGDEQPGETHDVDEQDMPDLELHIGGRLGGHKLRSTQKLCL